MVSYIEKNPAHKEWGEDGTKSYFKWHNGKEKYFE